jgi:ATP-dependent helicase HepA
VLFDLPFSPAVVEQRIGRLDRIGRRIPVEIVYFRPPGGLGRDVASLYEDIGLFRAPLAGLAPELAPIETELEAAALAPTGTMAPGRLKALVGEVQAAHTRIREAAYRELHRDRYLAEMGPRILARIPADLDSLNEDVVAATCERLGFRVERPRGEHVFAFEFGGSALVDSVGGVPGGSSFLGTFDREEAVADETIDYFAAGHPLVEGVLAHLDEAALGRVAVVGLHVGQERGFGLAAFHREPAGFSIEVVDEDGAPRPSWGAALKRRPFRTRRVSPQILATEDWMPRIRRMLGYLDPARRPVAVAAIFVGG